MAAVDWPWLLDRVAPAARPIVAAALWPCALDMVAVTARLVVALALWLWLLATLAVTTRLTVALAPWAWLLAVFAATVRAVVALALWAWLLDMVAPAAELAPLRAVRFSAEPLSNTNYRPAVAGRTLCVNAPAAMVTLVPDVKAPIIMLEAAVPQDTSITAVVPSDLNIRAQVGVMLATATPAVMALDVNKPFTDAGKATAPKVKVTPNVLAASAVSPVAGCAPS